MLQEYFNCESTFGFDIISPLLYDDWVWTAQDSIPQEIDLLILEHICAPSEAAPKATAPFHEQDEASTVSEQNLAK